MTISETNVNPMHVVTIDAYGIDRPYTYRIDWGNSDPISGNAPFFIYGNSESCFIKGGLDICIYHF